MQNLIKLVISTLILAALLSLRSLAAEPLDDGIQSPSAGSLDSLGTIKLPLIAESDAKNSYYLERKSYSTARDTDPPRYVKQANKTWLKNYEDFKDLDWLDIGLDHRLRYEYRDNDFRRSTNVVDEPILLRTRAYVAVKKILDPLRLTLEVQDARRNHSQFSRSNDTRDIDLNEPIQGYLELYFAETPLGVDALNNTRPVSIKAGRQAFEYLDRRLISRNEWRNTANTFQGIRATIGQQANDWQVDVFSLKPIQRFGNRLDEVDHAQDFYGVLLDWRRWSNIVTLQPYYLLLTQDGAKVKYDTNGALATASAKVDREIHTLGLRAYGVIAKTGWDYDLSYSQQWGNQDKLQGAKLVELNHQAYAYTAELGYSFQHAWKPRLSLFHGVASGDGNPTDTTNGRFERLFGFGRPWSASDYGQMENINATKLRAEFEPQFAGLQSLKVDTGYSWYALDSASDRWNAGNNLTDPSGKSGNDLGQEFDVRVRFPINAHVSTNWGYSHFWAGSFVQNNLLNLNRPDHSDFVYMEISLSAF